MTALFLNLHASFWNVYKVDLEGSKKKCKPKVKQYSCEKSYAFLQNLKFWSDFLFSFPFSPTYNKSLFILPPTPIMYELLKLIFSLPFLFQKHTDTKKKGGGGNHYSLIPTRNYNNCLSDLHNNMRDLSKAEFLWVS